LWKILGLPEKMRLKFKLDTLMVGRKEALDKIANGEPDNRDRDYLTFTQGKRYHVFINVLNEKDEHQFYVLLDEDNKLVTKAVNFPSEINPNTMGENVRSKLRDLERDLDKLSSEIECIRNND
jgi:hypothetical protein